MKNLAKWPFFGGVWFTGKGVAFVILAALEMTPLPPVLLAGLSLTWFAFGVMLLLGARRMERLSQPAEKPAPRTTLLTDSH